MFTSKNELRNRIEDLESEIFYREHTRLSIPLRLSEIHRLKAENSKLISKIEALEKHLNLEWVKTEATEGYNKKLEPEEVCFGKISWDIYGGGGNCSNTACPIKKSKKK